MTNSRHSVVARIAVLRDTALNFLSLNPILDSGEMGLETDTGLFKFGDGNRQWSLLPYANKVAAPEDGYYLRQGSNWIKLADSNQTLVQERWQLTMEDGSTRTVKVLLAE